MRNFEYLDLDQFFFLNVWMTLDRKMYLIFTLIRSTFFVLFFCDHKTETII